jgi:hypothetical protein
MMKTAEIDLHVLRNHAVVAGSEAAPEGMLVLCDEANLFIHVLNPLTGHVIELPSVKTLHRGRGYMTLFPRSYSTNTR